jgi:hypothetical protein
MAFPAQLTSNIHKLLHVPAMIRRGGPVHEFSVCALRSVQSVVHSHAHQCSKYERMQATLNKKNVNSTRIPEQLIKSDWMLKLSSLSHTYYPEKLVRVTEATIYRRMIDYCEESTSLFCRFLYQRHMQVLYRSACHCVKPSCNTNLQCTSKEAQRVHQAECK